jgi:membrane protease YdiL (CAAX protease family)
MTVWSRRDAGRAGRRTVTETVRAHPVTSLLLWFFTVGQAVAFLPVVADLPIAPFVVVSTLLGLLLPTLVLTRMVDGAAGLRLLWRRVTTVPAGWTWYALAVIVVPLSTVAVAAALFGLPAHLTVPALGWAVLVGLLLPTVLGLLVSNLAEEVAWQGFVQTRLQDRRGPMVAALLTGPLFALQHLPLLVAGAGPAALLLLLPLAALAVPFRALLAWVDNRTGSLLLVGLVHAAGNAAAGGTGFGSGLLPRLYPDLTPGPLHIVAFAVLGLVVIGGTRGRLGTSRAGSR